MSQAKPTSSQLQIYGSDDCPQTQAMRRRLDQLNILHEYVDIDADDDVEAWVREQGGGELHTPTIDVDGEVLVAPSEEAVQAAIRRHDMRNAMRR